MYKLTESMSKCIIDTRPKSYFHFNSKETTLVANFLKTLLANVWEGYELWNIGLEPCSGQQLFETGRSWDLEKPHFFSASGWWDPMHSLCIFLMTLYPSCFLSSDLSQTKFLLDCWPRQCITSLTSQARVLMLLHMGSFLESQMCCWTWALGLVSLS